MEAGQGHVVTDILKEADPCEPQVDWPFKHPTVPKITRSHDLVPCSQWQPTQIAKDQELASLRGVSYSYSLTMDKL